MAPSRRSAVLLPAALAGAAVCLIVREAPSFLSAAAPKARSRVVMQGFKEDFDAWRSALSPEERKLVLTQAQGEFNKKFRKSDDFKKDIPGEKVKAFGKILSKFFDAEAADYKKEADLKTPNYNALLERAGDKELDFTLKNRVIEIDRDADRRYNFASTRIREAESKGELWPQSSPQMELWAVKNDDAASHEKAVAILDFMKKAGEDASCPKDVKPLIDQWVAKGIPPVGTAFELAVPQVLSNQLLHMVQIIKGSLEAYAQNATEAQVEAWKRDKLPEVGARTIKFMTDKYVAARDEIENAVKTQKEFFRSQRDMPGKTKADILKEIWAELPKYASKPVPPLDEETLAELAQVPAVLPGELKHSWGTADKLYKSEAVDPFGLKYLLGVFETKEEAQKAFADWNGEYTKARQDAKAEMMQWSKQENARLDKDTAGRERIAKVIEESRSGA